MSDENEKTVSAARNAFEKQVKEALEVRDTYGLSYVDRVVARLAFDYVQAAHAHVNLSEEGGHLSHEQLIRDTVTQRTTLLLVRHLIQLGMLYGRNPQLNEGLGIHLLKHVQSDETLADKVSDLLDARLASSDEEAAVETCPKCGKFMCAEHNRCHACEDGQPGKLWH